MNQISKLPSCEYRVEIENTNVYGCRHQRVFSPGHKVTPSICLSCKVRLSACESPRSIDEVKNPKNFPSLVRRGRNFAQAATDFVADGCRTLEDKDYQLRLIICKTCESRNGDYCRECGCKLSLKAKGRVFQCPLGKWPDITLGDNKEAR